MRRERMLSYDFSVPSKPRLVIATNFLPVEVEKDNDHIFVTTPNMEELTLAVYSLRNDFDIVWVGWPRHVFDPSDYLEVSDELQVYKMVPVFLTENEVNLHLRGFCRQLLWMHFHNIPDTSIASLKKDLYIAYENVNKKFADVISSFAQPSDVIWVHGHELLLLPAMLREKFPTMPIGYFLHIPFPLQHFFCIIPNRKQLLEGMLGADLIGFQTYDYSKTFTACVYNILGFSANLRKLEIEQRIVTVDEFPMGIDYEFFTSEDDEDPLEKLSNGFCYTPLLPPASSHVTPKLVEELENIEVKQKLIISSDRIDQTNDLCLRINAYRYALEMNPNLVGQVVLLLLVQPPLFSSPLFDALKDEVDQLVANVNGTFGNLSWKPIIYLYDNLSLLDMKRLYRRADVCLSLPRKAGMGLLAKEYAAAKQREGRGVLILGENMGAAKELNEALIVNPYNMKGVAETIVRALEMPIEEQASRLASMKERLARNDTRAWASRFVASILEASAASLKSGIKRLAGIYQLSVVKKYRQAVGSRLLILDYDGTLVDLDEEGKAPDPELLQILTDLAADPKNTVVINSGRDKNTLEEWFSSTGVDIAAQHGMWIKCKEEWRKVVTVTNEWKTEVYGLLENLFENIQGVHIEETDYSLLVNVDQDKLYSDRIRERLRSQSDTLRYLMMNAGFRIIESDSRIEIKSAVVSKGRAVLNWLKSGQAASNWDFILCIGDDYTDEDTFRELPPDATTIKVGTARTSAKYYLMNAFHVRMFLKDLLRTQF